MDAAGNLYGTTYYGGAYFGGTVFKLDTSGTETVLYNFTGADGLDPDGGLILDKAGNLYGTASSGGAGGFGTVFKLNTSGMTVLYSFTGGADGSNPSSGLVMDAAGNFYGTTVFGGGYGCRSNCGGTVFMVDKTGKETVLYSFLGGTDGNNPYSGLVRDAAGNLYGTTLYGGGDGCAGRGCGTVFMVDKTGKEIILHSFTGGTDGGSPGDLVRAAGNLYGITKYGGNLSCNPPNGCGVVFKVTP
jgi:uncharacterized repeat protein (TIGR03803 family)